MKLNLVEDEDVAIDMSPMIDMVFLLLIFFIVASVVVDEKPPVNLSVASASKVAEDIKDRMQLSIDAAENIYIGSVVTTEDNLKTRLMSELDMNPNLRVFIRSDETVPFRVNKKLMTLCADVGAVNLIYAAYEE
jgi:biopolymer transport protein ExbD